MAAVEIVAKPDDWLVTDQEKWAAFLDSETGKRLIAAVADSAPPLLCKGEINEILIRTGEVRGIQACLRELISRAHPSAPVAEVDARTAYPALENDAAWNDGQKLTPETPKDE